MRKQKMVRDEVDLELIGHDIQKQRQILQQDKQQIQEQREELERTIVELFKKVEEANNLFDVINKDKSKMKELNLCLKTRGDKLKVLMNMIALKPQRLQSESPEFHTQTQNLELCRKRIQETQEELEDLMKNAITMKEQVQVSISGIQKDKDQMISMKKDIEKDREKLSYEKERLKRERSKFKMRQDKLLNKLKSTANLRLTLQGVKDAVWEHTKEKIGRLNKTHEDAQLLCISLENKLSTVGEKMNRITPYKELFEREKINLRSIISSMSNQREMMEYQWKKMVDLDKEDLNKVKAELKLDRQNLEGVAGKIDKDKVGLELMMSDIQKERAILQKEQRDIKEEREQMKITKTQLDLKDDESKSCWAEIHKEKAKLKDLSVSVQRKQQRLQDIMNTLALKQQDTQRRGQMFHTQTQTLQSKRIQVQKEKEEIEVLMSTANKMKEWLKAAMASVHKEKEPADYSRVERREEKHMLSTQDIELERERYELKTREDDIALEKRRETERHKVQIQHLKEKLNEYMTIKRDQLKLSTEGVERLHVVLGQMLRSLNEQKENMAGYKEVFEREKETLNALLYDTQKQRVQLDNQWNQLINMEQWNAITLQAEQQKEKLVLDMRKQKMVRDEVDLELIGHDIQKQRQILQQDKQQIQEQREELERTIVELFKKVEEANNLFDVINKDKSKMKELNLCLKTRGDKLKVLMNMIALKPQRLQSESPEFHTQTQNLELCRKRIQETQEELEDLMKNAITMKEQVQVSISGIQKDKDQMISMKKDIEKDREKLSYEKERLKRERSKFKMRQDKLLNKLKSTANLRLTLQGVKDAVWEHTKEKIGRLNKTHEDAQLLCISLENKLSTVGEKMNRITPYKELFEREKINLRSIISSMSNQREMMEYQWKKMVDLDKEDLNKVKAELKLDRQNLEGVAGKIDKDKVGLELMMSDIQKRACNITKRTT
ncbi:myosin-3-like [Fundulus heteroclitus]|uniref:myosin-3-like n=1 Tax=Fundulus heteroclitus TaxID=8078 RepID=UPI00165BF9B8|nr:myosin-3-like [Fundulus heteroclitus]